MADLSMMEFSLKHRVKRGDPPSRRSGANNQPLLVLLHGVGGHEENFIRMADQFDDRLVIISARGPFEQSPSSFGWYRTSPFLDERNFFLDDAEESRQKLVQFIHEAVSNYEIDPDQVYLFGFDQGATLGLSVFLTEPGLISGLMAVSGEILPEVLHMRASKSRLREFPVFLAYGVHDQVISIQDGRKVRDMLTAFDVDISYREYSSGHDVSPNSLRDAAAWLTFRLEANRRTWFADAGHKIHLGHIQIKVRDLDRSIAFYKRFLGLRMTERMGRAYGFLSSSHHHHDLVLQSIGPEALDAPPDSVGMVNLAFEAADQRALAELYKNLTDSGIQVRTSDHFISWSIYFNDPDGNEIEIYCDTRDMLGRSDMWQGRDSPLDPRKILALLDEDR